MQSFQKAFDRGCGKKFRHPSEEAAIMAMIALRDSNCKRKTRLNVYKCKFGDHWHVGRKRKDRKR